MSRGQRFIGPLHRHDNLPGRFSTDAEDPLNKATSRFDHDALLRNRFDDRAVRIGEQLKHSWRFAQEDLSCDARHRFDRPRDRRTNLRLKPFDQWLVLSKDFVLSDNITFLFNQIVFDLTRSHAELIGKIDRKHFPRQLCTRHNLIGTDQIADSDHDRPR